MWPRQLGRADVGPAHGPVNASAQLLYEPLASYADQIAGSAYRQNAVPFVESTWRSWLASSDIDASVIDTVFSSLGKGATTRSEIRDLAALPEQDADRRLTLFIAVLIWGRGKNNGRMRDPILRVLNNPRRDEILASTAELAIAGDAADAFKAWRLPGLQSAFFTKWLWAASSAHPERCCLVQDKLVWDSLNAFGWNSRDAAGGSRNRAVRYAAYVRDARLCSEQLSSETFSVTAEDVEYTLFDIRGNFPEWIKGKQSR